MDRKYFFDPPPEVEDTFKRMFGDDPLIPGLGKTTSKESSTHFSFVNPLNVNAEKPGWHVTTQIHGLDQGRRIARHDFLSDFTDDTPTFNPSKKSATAFRSLFDLDKPTPELPDLFPVLTKTEPKQEYQIDGMTLMEFSQKMREKERERWTKPFNPPEIMQSMTETQLRRIVDPLGAGSFRAPRPRLFDPVDDLLYGGPVRHTIGDICHDGHLDPGFNAGAKAWFKFGGGSSFS